jgi:predicted oxidoreductase
MSRVREEPAALAATYGCTPIQIAPARLPAHPVNIIPLVGSNSPEHICEDMGALKITISREDWYRLWVPVWGRRLPQPCAVVPARQAQLPGEMLYGGNGSDG